MDFLNIAGGIALILFGVRFLRKGLARIFGHALHAWLERMVKRRWTASLAGAMIGAIAPSSTAQTLIALQLLRSARVALTRILIFLLGANVGITIAVQLLALHWFDYYPLFLMAGFLAFQYGRIEWLRGTGQALFAIGLIYLAMNIMGHGARGLMEGPDLQALFQIALRHGLVVLAASALLTLVTMSSTASIGLGLVFGEARPDSFGWLIFAVLGANLGIGINSVVAGWSSAQGRRLGAASLFLKAVVAAGLIAVARPLIHGVEGMPGSLARHVADFHTGFNIVVVLVGMALSTPLEKLLARANRRAAATVIPSVTTHLDDTALTSPSFALANATREILAMADEVKVMLAGAWRAFGEGNPELARTVHKHDDRIDELNANIKLYLSRIRTEAMTAEDKRLQFGLLHFCSQLESIADIVDKNIGAFALKSVNLRQIMCVEDRADLEALYSQVVFRINGAISVLASRDRTLARHFLAESATLKHWCVEAQQRHYRRLNGADGVAASELFIDVFGALRRISGQLNTIGHTFADEKSNHDAPEAIGA